jgi:uncharacterized membrane protein
MTAPTRAELDDFGRRLRDLEADFAALQSRATVADEQPAARITPPRLAIVRMRFERGDLGAALKEAHRLRSQSLRSRSVAELEELLELLQSGIAPNSPAVQSLIYGVTQNIAAVQAAPAARPSRPAQSPVRPAQPAPVPAQPAPREPRFSPPSVTAADLLGPRALAIAGGIVTVLGIVFFFVLAVNRGWIGPPGRIALGGIASFLVFAGGLELRRRYGETHAALAAVGAGIAGGYATLLSAAALYDMLPDWGALLIAGAIASAGVVTSLRWGSQILAGIGLIGATLVPVATAAQGGVSPVGTSFVGIVFAATAIVAIRQGWRELLIAGALASAPQIVALVVHPAYRSQHPLHVVALAGAFSVLYAAVGVAHRLRSGGSAYGRLATSFVLGGGALAAGAAVRLFETADQRGFAFLAVSLAYAVACGFFFRRLSTRDLSAVLAFGALTLGGFAFGELLSGQPLAFAWAAEAAGLSWLARRSPEIRFQVWSAVYLVLALAHVVAFDSPPRWLFVEVAHPAVGVPAVLALGAAAFVFGHYARPWETVPPLLRRFADVHAHLRHAGYLLAALSGTLAASLGVIAAFASFEWAHVALVGLWSGLGLLALAAGFRFRSGLVRSDALAWFAVVTYATLSQGFHLLDQPERAWSFVLVGLALLTVSVAYALRHSEESLDAVAATGALAGLALLLYAIGSTLDAVREGLVLLGLSCVYGALATVFFRLRRSRDTTTLYCAVALTVAAGAEPLLLHGTLAVLGWALGGVALTALARRAGEPRLFVAAAGYLTLAIGRAVLVQAPPSHLFTESAHPAYGSASIFIAAAAVGVASVIAGGALDLLGEYRNVPAWTAAVLAVYGASLVILELVERISGGSSHTSLQRGETTVSAFWAFLGLALLYVGLKRRLGALRIAGLGLFVVSLAKIFLYDLPALSSITRALSFLAVGGVLLLGGFFYQRLGQSGAQTP